MQNPESDAPESFPAGSATAADHALRLREQGSSSKLFLALQHALADDAARSCMQSKDQRTSAPVTRSAPGRSDEYTSPDCGQREKATIAGLRHLI